MRNSEWYGVRTVYEHTDRSRTADDGTELRVYEERIVLVQAPDEDMAIARAESEAELYAGEGTAYLRYAMASHIFDPPHTAVKHSRPTWDGHEVFSLMRESSLPPQEYLDTFFDTGTEKTR